MCLTYTHLFVKMESGDGNCKGDFSMKFLITFDFYDQSANYDDLFFALKLYGSWVKISRTAWVVRTTKSTTEILIDLKQYINDSDSIFVCAFEHCSFFQIPENAKHFLTD